MMNYHFHDQHSSDATRPIEEHCAIAAELGFSSICVTNHVETLQSDGSWTVDFEEAAERFERVRQSVRTSREQYPELEIGFGAEFAFRPEWTRSLERLAAEFPFDFVLGSLHDVDGIDVSGPDAPAFFTERSVETAYGRYFEALRDLVAWGQFDVVSHFDLVKRFGHRAYGPYDPTTLEGSVRAVLEAMAASGLGIEINTSGAVQPPRAPYPNRPVLDWAREAGVPYLTIGSDAHAPRHFGQGIRTGLSAARAAGWTELTRFVRRQPAGSIPIPRALAALESQEGAAYQDERSER